MAIEISDAKIKIQKNTYENKPREKSRIEQKLTLEIVETDRDKLFQIYSFFCDLGVNVIMSDNQVSVYSVILIEE